MGLYVTARTSLVALLTVAPWLVAAPALAAETLRLAYASWVAYGPFFIARDKGWLAEEGVEVAFVKIEDAGIRAAALITGDVDATALTLDATPLHVRRGMPLRFAFALASSRGNDALLAASDIETIADLKGKTVAVDAGASGRFFVSELLQSVGLSETDITIVDMRQGDAGAAFLAGKVDAAVTWEPYLSRAKRAGRGHRLTDTSHHPGLITDMLVVRGDRLEQRRDDFRALYRAWNRAVAFAEADPEAAAAIMAKGVGGWLRHREVFAEVRAGVGYFDAAANELFFGTQTAPGLVSETTGRAIELWRSFGKLAVDVKGSDLVSYAVVGE